MRYLRDYLDELMREVQMVATFTQEGKAAFMADERTQYAVMMAYARIGEIVKNIPNEVLATQPQVEWTQVKGFRDVLMHRYFEINVERVWQAVEKLPALQAAAAHMQASLPPEDIDE